MNRFRKVGATPVSDVEQFPIIRDERTGLMWDRREFDEMTMDEAKAHIVKLNKSKFGAYADWRLPECDELLSLVDRTRHDPAIDMDAFPKCKSSWYRSATPTAWSPADRAWFVGFSYGYCSYGHRFSSGFVRAVRPSQS